MTIFYTDEKHNSLAAITPTYVGGNIIEINGTS